MSNSRLYVVFVSVWSGGFHNVFRSPPTGNPEALAVLRLRCARYCSKPLPGKLWVICSSLKGCSFPLSRFIDFQSATITRWYCQSSCHRLLLFRAPEKHLRGYIPLGGSRHISPVFGARHTRMSIPGSGGKFAQHHQPFFDFTLRSGKTASGKFKYGRHSR